MSLSSSLKSPVSSLISVLARSRTWSTTFAKSRAIRYTSRTEMVEGLWLKVDGQRRLRNQDFLTLNLQRSTINQNYPTKDSNLALRFRRPPCVHHTRWACQAGDMRLETEGKIHVPRFL